MRYLPLVLAIILSGCCTYEPPLQILSDSMQPSPSQAYLRQKAQEDEQTRLLQRLVDIQTEMLELYKEDRNK